MQAGYFPVGLDRRTGEAKVFHALPPETANAAKSLGGIPANGPAMIGDRPLSTEAVRAIAVLAKVELDLGHLDYCIEPHQALPSASSTRAAE
jgi:hypothetical protein